MSYFFKVTKKQILPPKYLLFAEYLGRKVLFPFYKGQKFQCTICEKKLRKFIHLRNNEKWCPGCGSLSRDRRLWLLLKPFLTDNTRLLHFSPSLSLSRRLRRYPGIQYATTDYKGCYPVDKRLEITRLDEPNSTYNLIICYHVLEHVADDRKAMQELARVLQPGGKCFMQSPFKNGMIYENRDKTSPEERKNHFGGKNHVRVYSVEGLKARLRNIGFDVVSTRFTEKHENYYGLKEEEYVVTALKY